MQNLNKFEVNPTNEFHILRHFEFVDNTYKKTLINKPYWYYEYSQEKFIASHISEDDIQYALGTIGTKFYKNIPGIENPQKLLKLIKRKLAELNSDNKILWTDRDGEKRFSFTIRHDFPVGDKNVLSMNELSDNDKVNVKQIFRSKCKGEKNILINTVTGLKLEPTNIIYIEMLETKQLPFFAITAFPECLANNIPDNELVFGV